MAHFTESAVTDTGVAMLNEMLAGRYLNITKAAGGDGTVDASELHSQTALQSEKQTLALLNDIIDDTGRTLAIQAKNADEAYSLEQIGVFGKLLQTEGGEPVEGYEEEKLIFLMQDKDPVSIPDSSAGAFMLNVYAHLNISNTGTFSVTIDKTGVVNIELLEQYLQAHDANKDAHLIPDDNAPDTKFRFGIEDGKLYVQTVTATEV